jgi:fumarate hydratase class II
VRVMGNDTAVSLAASQGNFQLNVFLPVTAYSFLAASRSAMAWARWAFSSSNFAFTLA